MKGVQVLEGVQAHARDLVGVQQPETRRYTHSEKVNDHG